MSNKIRIKLSSYDHNLLDRSTDKIVKTVKATGATVSGPIPLPTKKYKYTVLRGPHIDKKAREQFEQCKHKRMIHIYASNTKAIESLMKLEISSAIQIEMKV